MPLTRKQLIDAAESICAATDGDSDPDVIRFIAMSPALLRATDTQIQRVRELNGLFPAEMTMDERKTIIDIVAGFRPAVRMAIRRQQMPTVG